MHVAVATLSGLLIRDVDKPVGSALLMLMPFIWYATMALDQHWLLDGLVGFLFAVSSYLVTRRPSLCPRRRWWRLIAGLTGGGSAPSCWCSPACLCTGWSPDSVPVAARAASALLTRTTVPFWETPSPGARRDDARVVGVSLRRLRALLPAEVRPRRRPERLHDGRRLSGGTRARAAAPTTRSASSAYPPACA